MLQFSEVLKCLSVLSSVELNFVLQFKKYKNVEAVS